MDTVACLLSAAGGVVIGAVLYAVVLPIERPVWEPTTAGSEARNCVRREDRPFVTGWMGRGEVVTRNTCVEWVIRR